MNKFVSMPSEPQPQKSPETPPPSEPIPSLKKAMAFVNRQTQLSTEMLFKTLLVYHKPDQGLFATRRDPQFLATAINKESSHGIVSDETQKEIASAIFTERFGNPMPPAVALAIASKLDTFTDPVAQTDIASAICNGVFGNPTIPPEVALAIATNLGTFKEEDAQRNIALAIGDVRFGDPIPPDVARVLVSNLHTFTEPEAQLNISGIQEVDPSHVAMQSDGIPATLTPASPTSSGAVQPLFPKIKTFFSDMNKALSKVSKSIRNPSLAVLLGAMGWGATFVSIFTGFFVGFLVLMIGGALVGGVYGGLSCAVSGGKAALALARQDDRGWLGQAGAAVGGGIAGFICGACVGGLVFAAQIPRAMMTMWLHLGQR